MDKEETGIDTDYDIFNSHFILINVVKLKYVLFEDMIKLKPWFSYNFEEKWRRKYMNSHIQESLISFFNFFFFLENKETPENQLTSRKTYVSLSFKFKQLV